MYYRHLRTTFNTPSMCQFRINRLDCTIQLNRTNALDWHPRWIWKGASFMRTYHEFFFSFHFNSYPCLTSSEYNNDVINCEALESIHSGHIYGWNSSKHPQDIQTDRMGASILERENEQIAHSSKQGDKWLPVLMYGLCILFSHSRKGLR